MCERYGICDYGIPLNIADFSFSALKAYEGVRTEMIEASRNHQKIANNIRELVVAPFRRWSEQHEYRVGASHDNLQARIKEHTKQVELAKKLRSTYFNKCRVLEDLEEENKLAFQDPDTSPKLKATPKIILPTEEEPEEEPVELGDRIFSPEEIKKILVHMLNNIRIGEAKVPIIGTYQNTSTGADIVEYGSDLHGCHQPRPGRKNRSGSCGWRFPPVDRQHGQCLCQQLQDELPMAQQGFPAYRYS